MGSEAAASLVPTEGAPAAPDWALSPLWAPLCGLALADGVAAGAALGAVTGVAPPEEVAAPDPPREAAPELRTACVPGAPAPDAEAAGRVALESTPLATALFPEGAAGAAAGDPPGRELGAGTGAALGSGA